MSMYTKASLEDGIPLTQIWQTLSRNCWLIGLIFVVFMIAGYILWSVLPPTYRARAQINVGSVRISERIDLFEKPDDLIARLMDEYGRSVEPGGYPVLKIAQLRKNTSTVELVVEGREWGATRNFLESITKRVLESHQQSYDQSTASLMAQLKALDNHQQALEKEYAEVSRLIDQNLNAPKADLVQLTLLSIQRSQIRQALIDVDMRRPAIISNLNSPGTRLTVLVGKIDAPGQPAAPKRALILVAAAMLGMIFGVLAAFCRDAVRAARSTQSND